MSRKEFKNVRFLMNYLTAIFLQVISLTFKAFEIIFQEFKSSASFPDFIMQIIKNYRGFLVFTLDNEVRTTYKIRSLGYAAPC